MWLPSHFPANVLKSTPPAANCTNFGLEPPWMHIGKLMRSGAFFSLANIAIQADVRQKWLFFGFSNKYGTPCSAHQLTTSAQSLYSTLAALTRTRSLPDRLGMPSGYSSDRSGGGPPLLVTSLAREAVPHGGAKVTSDKSPSFNSLQSSACPSSEVKSSQRVLCTGRSLLN